VINSASSDQQMNMITGGDVVQHAQSVSLGCLEQPIFPTRTVAFKLKQKLPTVTSMSNMPYGSGNKESIRSGHKISYPA
jgi:hypothetical protein